MQYLITTMGILNTPFLTNWYTYENVFDASVGMVVYDLVNKVYTTDGKTWQEIEIDHL